MKLKIRPIDRPPERNLAPAAGVIAPVAADSTLRSGKFAPFVASRRQPFDYLLSPGEIAYRRCCRSTHTIRVTRATGCARNAMQMGHRSYRMADPLGHILPAVSIDTTWVMKE